MLLCVALVAAMGAAAFANNPPDDPEVVVQNHDPADAGDATVDAIASHNNQVAANHFGTFAGAIAEIRTAVEAYEKVRDSKAGNDADVDAAYGKMKTALTNIHDKYVNAGTLADADAINGVTFKDLTTAATYSGYTTVPAGAVNIEVEAPVTDTNGNEIDTARDTGALRTSLLRLQAGLEVLSAQEALAVIYDMSEGKPMDWNSYIINATGVHQAQETKDAKAAADAAKAGALTAQSTAKSLINKAMAIAQDAAAEAVADAQATAYNNLAAAYATAVSDFWNGVAAEFGYVTLP